MRAAPSASGLVEMAASKQQQSYSRGYTITTQQDILTVAEQAQRGLGRPLSSPAKEMSPDQKEEWRLLLIKREIYYYAGP